VRDITAQKLGEEAMRENKARFHGIFDLAPDAIFIADPAGRFVQVNDAACRSLGYTREELLLRRLTDVVDADCASQAEQRLGELRESPGYYESCHITRDGARVPVELAVQRIRLGGQPAMMAIARDVSERHQAKEQQSRLMALIEHSSDAIGLTTNDGLFLYLNRAGARMLGLDSAEQSNGRSILAFVPPSARHDFATRLLPTVLREGRWVGEGPIQSARDGQTIMAEMTLFLPAAAPTASPVLALIMRDVTSRLRAQEERSALESQLRQVKKMEAVGRLAGRMAQDFDRIVTAILGHSDRLQAALPADAALQDELEQIRAAAAQAGMLTAQLLALSRKQLVAPKVLDLNELLVEALPRLEPLIDEQVELRLLRNPRPCWVRAEARQIEQLLVHMVRNACDAMPSGGTLTIATSESELDRAYCDRHLGATPGPYALLRVSDTGHGMTAEVLEHLFEPFFTTKPAGQGAGLGLSLVYGFVSQSEGVIEVESQQNRGTTFRIHLPTALSLPTHPPEPEQSAGEPEVPRGSETVLLVEDEPMVLQLGQRILERQGYRVLPATSAEEALELFETHAAEIQLLVTDVVLPKISGRRLFQMLLARKPILRAVFVSGYANLAVTPDAPGPDASGFLPKPFTLPTLATKVREVLDR